MNEHELERLRRRSASSRTDEARQLLHRVTPGFVDEEGEPAGYREPNRAERRRAAKWLRRRGKGYTR